MPLSDQQALEFIKRGKAAGISEDAIKRALQREGLASSTGQPYQPLAEGQPAGLRYEVLAEARKGERKMELQGPVMAAGAMLGGFVAGPRVLPQIAGEMAGTYLTGRMTGMEPKEAGTAALMAGGGGALGRSVAYGGTRLAGRMAGLHPETVKAGIRDPSLTRPAGPQAERHLGEELLNEVNLQQQSLPQLRRNFRASEFELQSETDRILRAQELARRNLSARGQAEEFGRATETRLGSQRAAESRTGEAVALREGFVKGKQAATLSRNEAIGKVSRDLEQTLGQAESELTAGRTAKEKLLQDATDKGVTIDVEPLLEAAEQLMPVKPTTGPRISAKSSLENFIANVRQNYGSDVGPLVGPTRVSPVEADRILQDMRAVSPSTYGDINQAESGRLFHRLQADFKNQIYDAVAGSGEASQQARRVLEAREGLRTYLSKENPGSFVKQIVAGGPGARDRLLALREFESTHETSGALEKSINDIAETYGESLKQLGQQQRAGVQAANNQYQRAISRLREGDFKGRQAAETIRQKRLDALEAGYKKKLDALDIQLRLAKGDYRGAFAKQPSTPQQQQKFEAIEGVRSAATDSNVSKFIKRFRAGREDQDAVANLRRFEQQAETGGVLERRARELAMKREWAGSDWADAYAIDGLLQPTRPGVIKSLALPVARFGARNVGRVGPASAGAVAAFEGVMSRKKLVRESP